MRESPVVARCRVICNLITQCRRDAVKLVAAVSNIGSRRGPLLGTSVVPGTAAYGTVVFTQRLLWFPIRVRPNRSPFTIGLAILAIVNNSKRKPFDHLPPF